MFSPDTMDCLTLWIAALTLGVAAATSVPCAAVGDGAQPSSSEAGAATAGEGTVGEDKGMHSKQWKPTNPPQKGQGYGCITRLEYVNSSCIKVRHWVSHIIGLHCRGVGQG